MVGVCVCGGGERRERWTERDGGGEMEGEREGERVSVCATNVTEHRCINVYLGRI